MFRKFVARVGSKMKHNKLDLDPQMSSAMLFEFIFVKCIEFLRGLKLFFRIRAPRLLFLGTGVKFSYLHKIQIGKGVSIGRYSHLSGFGAEGLSLADGVSIGDFCNLIVSTTYSRLGEYIRIGEGVGIGDYSRIGGSGGVHIMKDTIIANYFSAHPENHIFARLDIPIKYQSTERKEIVVGEGCWIGAKVTILAGVTLGSHCVVAAGSVVTKSVPDYSIIMGVPARIVGNRLEMRSEP